MAGGGDRPRAGGARRRLQQSGETWLTANLSALPCVGMRTVVLVPGSHHGPWCWWRVVDGLQAAGVPTVAVDLPFTGFEDDTAATKRALGSVPGPFVVCGHSYGGMVISAASAKRSGPRSADIRRSRHAVGQLEIRSFAVLVPTGTCCRPPRRLGAHGCLIRLLSSAPN